YGVYGKQPLFVKLALAAVSVIYIMLLQDSVYWFFSYYGGAGLVAPTMLLLSAALLYAKYSLIYFIVLLKGGRHALRMEPDARWAFKLLHNTKAVFRLKNIPLIICLLLLYLSVIASVVVFCAGIVAIGYEMPAALILLSLSAAAFCICAMFVSLIHAFAKTAEYAKSIAEGVYPEIIEASGWFSQPAAYLSRINDGTRRAVEEAVRSERMKAELITNVSHDLKTPLTSIINYVALLKETPLMQSEAAAEYIGVIDGKTQRLKVLIEDLFEAAKLNSGSAAMEWEDVNVVDLLKQTLGELDEKILESGIIFLTRYSAEHITLRLDGKKMWRAFENLICNILKYAPAGSRAYISAEETSGGRVEIIFKNVANYEMDFNADELFERFVRGDASRSTEGSGLGLSIARGIVEHCGGSMRITTDGDLFKAAILFN
ncbi:MAG: sensor histidine kinase, partial [Clostridiales bacterium]|nr:sensor histidine kinase [Clostridiales bacterium]